jgi:predicted small metal-binding protein
MGTIEHGVSACYSNGPDGYRPTIICTCNWSAVEDTWEEVGERYDEHLAESHALAARSRQEQTHD